MIRAGLVLVIAFGTICGLTAGPMDIGSELQVFWDDAIVDMGKTTALRRLHQPVLAEEVFAFNEPWEMKVSYCHIVAPAEAGDKWRMYYLAISNYSAKVRRGTVPFDGQTRRVCLIESADGIRWTRPNLGLVDCGGSKANNIVLDEKMLHGCLDNFFVFRDTNPACPAEERCKAVANFEFKCDEKGLPKNYGCGPLGLEYYVSPDGLNWARRGYLMRDGLFDSLNVAYWDAIAREYRLYFRNAHCNTTDRNGDTFLRDIWYSTSKDFRTWTQPRQIVFEADAPDYALYTNAMMPYPRAPELSIGFPTRYVQRPKWTDTFDKLTGAAARKARMDPKKGGVPRYGLVTTDCVFMMTRDGVNFHREDEAFLRPGPERPGNWRYGDCYPAVGLVPTKARRGADGVYSLYVPEMGMWDPAGRPALSRYEVRQDGFVSRHATFAEQCVVTKELVFTGTNMLVNFSTSARGYLYVTIRDRLGAELKSCELFGDRVDRSVGFDSDVLDLTDFTGRPVTIEFRMSDADLYSFRFEGETFRDHPRHHTMWAWWPQSWLKILPDFRETASEDGVRTLEFDGLGPNGGAAKVACRFAQPKNPSAAVLLVADAPFDLDPWLKKGYAVLHCQPQPSTSTFMADTVNLGLAHSLLCSLTANRQTRTTVFVGFGRGADLGAALGAMDERFAGYVLAGGGFAEPEKKTLDNGRFLWRVKKPMAWIIAEETPAMKRAFAECGAFAGVEKAEEKAWTAAALRKAGDFLSVK